MSMGPVEPCVRDYPRIVELEAELAECKDLLKLKTVAMIREVTGDKELAALIDSYEQDLKQLKAERDRLREVLKVAENLVLDTKIAAESSRVDENPDSKLHLILFRTGTALTVIREALNKPDTK